ncbi:MAG TPA: metallophosphoesterase [Longimicrobium sp.]|nr:metallophosphoesterase [Longimicrobium sp.]
MSGDAHRHDDARLRIGVITDVHGNLPALRAVLAALDGEAVDVLYHTGDLLGIGPYPAECLEILINRPATRLLMGNHDAWFAFGLPTPRPEWMREGEYAHDQWVHAQLDPALRPVVAAWPYADTVRHGGVEIELLHYPLNPSAGGFFAPVDLHDADARGRVFGRQAFDLVFFGHDHRQWDVGSAPRLVSPGSVGCSEVAEARYAVVELAGDGGCEVRFGAVPYDAAGLMAEFDVRGVPERDFIRGTFMPRPPTGDLRG